MFGMSDPNQTLAQMLRYFEEGRYEMVEVMEYGTAHIYSAIMVLMSFIVLLSVYVFTHSQRKIGVL